MSRRFAALIAALTCSTALATAPLSAQNLVTNGSFETGDLTGWTVDVGGCPDASGIGVSSAAAHTGTYSAYVSGACWSHIAQSISVQAGHSYQVSFWAMAPSFPTPLDPGTRVEAEGVADAFGGIGGGLSEPGTWQYFANVASTASTTTTGTVRFGGWNDYGPLYVDDVSVVDVSTTPEPTSIALLGTGLVGLLPMLKRRRQQS